MADVVEVLKRYRAQLGRVVASYAPPGAEREDLVQEMRMALMTALPRFRGEGSERAYVLRIAHNVGLKHAHRRKTLRLEVDEEPPPDRTPSPEEGAVLQQRGERLAHAVRSLAVPYRQVIALALEEMSHREIGETLGLSENAVGVRMHRAKKQLREALKEV